MTVAQRLNAGERFSPHEWVEVGLGLVEELRFGHERRHVHGEVGPDLVTLVPAPGQTSGPASFEVQLDQPSGRPGRFQAPEVAAGGKPTPAADIYGMGCVLGEMSRALTAALPGRTHEMLGRMTASEPSQRPVLSEVEDYLLETRRMLGPAPVAAAAGAAAAPAAQEKKGPQAGAIAAWALVGVAALALGWVLVSALGGDGDSEADGSGDDGGAPVQGGSPGMTSEGGDSDSQTSDGEGSGGASGQPSEDDRDGEDDADQGDGNSNEGDADDNADGGPSDDDENSSNDDDRGGDGDGSTGGESNVWSQNGWDAEDLDAAYCRDPGLHFVALADSLNYRGVVCGDGENHTYYGLNRNNGAVLSTSASRDGEGWKATSDNATYKISEERFVISDGGSTLADEPVTTWIKPTDTPFRPGDEGIQRPITFPACDGSGVVAVESIPSRGDVKGQLRKALDDTPGSQYLRTDLACMSFPRPSKDESQKAYIYVVYVPVDGGKDALCRKAEDLGGTPYELREDLEPGTKARCD